jgi:hypothetical protein
MIADLVQNSIEADATEINLSIKETDTELSVVLSDNGKGMNAETLERARDPFRSDGRKHAHRKVGLGLPFLFQTAEMTGGTADIESQEGVGTTVVFRLDPAHVDLPVFGNFGTAAAMLMTYSDEGDIKIDRSVNGKSYSICRHALKNALGDLNDSGNLMLLKQFIEESEQEINEQE